jgi:ATP-binding cassette subfamily B protein
MIGVLVALFIEDARAGAAVGVFAAVAAFFLLKVAMLAVPVWAENRTKAAEFYGFLGERIAAREDLKSLGAAPYALARMKGLLGDWYPKRLKANILGYSLWTSSELARGIGTILSLGLGAALWRAGAISLGTVYLIYSYAELILQPLEQLRSQLEDLQKALAGTSRTMDILKQRPAMAYGEADIALGAIGLSFDGVSFGYESDKPVISSFSLDLAPGASLGVLGRTGCGKTTLGRLGLRLYDCDDGVISLNGRPIGDYSRQALRRGLAVVTQDVELFSATLRDNARLWDPEIGDEAILKAFGELGLEPWLAGFPSGLDQRLGSGGVGLSAGQAQLLAMVRVFLRDPGLVILDEASSRLDPATEALIDGAVAKLLRGRTAIIIAHRLSTLDRVDTVLVMEDGRAAEYGDRAELAADSSSLFYRFLEAGRSGRATRFGQDDALDDVLDDDTATIEEGAVL